MHSFMYLFYKIIGWWIYSLLKKRKSEIKIIEDEKQKTITVVVNACVSRFIDASMSWFDRKKFRDGCFGIDESVGLLFELISSVSDVSDDDDGEDCLSGEW